MKSWKEIFFSRAVSFQLTDAFCCRSAIAPEIAKNLATVTDAIKKVFNLIKRFKHPMQVTKKFVKKGLKIVSKINSFGVVKGLKLPAIIIMLQVGVGIIPVVLAVVCLLYVVFERKAQMSPTSQMEYVFMILVLVLLTFVSIIGFWWLVSEPIDLLILTVRFIPGWGFIWMIYGYVITIFGLIAWIICAFIGPPPEGTNEGNRLNNRKIPSKFNCERNLFSCADCVEITRRFEKCFKLCVESLA